MAGSLDTAAGLMSDGAAKAADLNWPALRYEHIVALRTLLQESGRKPATTNKILCAVRGVLKAA